MTDSGYEPRDEEARCRTGVLIGSGIGGLQGIEDASILVHELAHAAVARMAGFPVHDITLWVLGGYTSYERRSASAWRGSAGSE